MFHQVVTLEADVQEPRAAAAEMSADLARLGLDNGALQQDMGRKRQRLGGQEQAPAMGRALYQEYLRCLRLAGPPDGRAADPTLTTSVDRADRAATSQWVQHYPQVLETRTRGCVTARANATFSPAPRWARRCCSAYAAVRHKQITTNYKKYFQRSGFRVPGVRVSGCPCPAKWTEISYKMKSNITNSNKLSC